MKLIISILTLLFIFNCSYKNGRNGASQSNLEIGSFSMSELDCGETTITYSTLNLTNTDDSLYIITIEDALYELFGDDDDYNFYFSTLKNNKRCRSITRKDFRLLKNSDLVIHFKKIELKNTQPFGHKVKFNGVEQSTDATECLELDLEAEIIDESASHIFNVRIPGNSKHNVSRRYIDSFLEALCNK